MRIIIEKTQEGDSSIDSVVLPALFGLEMSRGGQAGGQGKWVPMCPFEQALHRYLITSYVKQNSSPER